MLTKEEEIQYSRHIILDEIGREGQTSLKNAKVLVIGAGGLGCPVLQYLTAAGVGTIGIIDYDNVDQSNLQRQVLFTTDDIGENKALAASKRLSKLNPNCNFITFQEQLTNKNALSIFERFEIIVDGTDNFQTRYMVSDACVILQKPLVYGSIFKFEGQASVFNLNDSSPTYRCLFPEPPEPGSVPSCSEVGVLGVLPGIIGSIQANETLKIILNLGNTLSGKLLSFDAKNMQFMNLKIKRNDEAFAKYKKSKINFETHDYLFECGLRLGNKDEISADEDFDVSHYNIIDIRESHEEPVIPFAHKKAPMSKISNINLEEILSTEKSNLIVCQSGQRSLKVIKYLKEKGDNTITYTNLLGGVRVWMQIW